LFGKAIIEFGGVRRECSMACVPDAEVGSYVIVHAGIAICHINESEAMQTLRDLQSIPEDE
jgi:hydrogenase expression/formation protein HypC